LLSLFDFVASLPPHVFEQGEHIGFQILGFTSGRRRFARLRRRSMNTDGDCGRLIILEKDDE
jgi:hypothetical protein